MQTSTLTRVQQAIENPFVRMRQAREILSVSESSLDRYIREGQLRVYRVGSRGHRRVKLHDLYRLLNSTEVTK